MFSLLSKNQSQDWWKKLDMDTKTEDREWTLNDVPLVMKWWKGIGNDSTNHSCPCHGSMISPSQESSSRFSSSSQRLSPLICNVPFISSVSLSLCSASSDILLFPFSSVWFIHSLIERFFHFISIPPPFVCLSLFSVSMLYALRLYVHYIHEYCSSVASLCYVASLTHKPKERED